MTQPLVEDTAVVEQDTAAPEVVEEQPQIEAPENLETEEAPETEAPDEAPETESQEEEPTPPKSLADLSEEELEGDERIQKFLKDREARARESARRSTESAERKRQADQARQFQQTGQASAYLAAMINQTIQRIQPKLENGEPVDSSERVPDQRMLNMVAGQMRTAAVLDAYNAWTQELETRIPLGDKLSTQDANALAEIHSDVTNGNFERFHELIEKRTELGYQARLDKELPKLKKQWEQDYKKQAEAAAKNARARDADGTEITEPTSRRGYGSPLGKARDVLEDAAAPIADRRRAYRDEYGLDPPW